MAEDENGVSELDDDYIRDMNGQELANIDDDPDDF